MQRLYIPGAGAVVDDSKSTCLAATRAALESLSGPVHLIAGGLGKGESLDALTDLLASRPVSLYLIGRSAPEMRVAWESSAVFCRECGDLATAVRIAWTRRNSRETLLLSPGCASFDQFAGFTERGIHFQREVQACANQHPLCPLESQETT
jgi:UDP-N-acetylmuramoylalanine--D-glutamate ligase